MQNKVEIIHIIYLYNMKHKKQQNNNIIKHEYLKYF